MIKKQTLEKHIFFVTFHDVCFENEHKGETIELSTDLQGDNDYGKQYSEDSV